MSLCRDGEFVVAFRLGDGGGACCACVQGGHLFPCGTIANHNRCVLYLWGSLVVVGVFVAYGEVHATFGIRYDGHVIGQYLVVAILDVDANISIEHSVSLTSWGHSDDGLCRLPGLDGHYSSLKGHPVR